MISDQMMPKSLRTNKNMFKYNLKKWFDSHPQVENTEIYIFVFGFMNKPNFSMEKNSYFFIRI